MKIHKTKNYRIFRKVKGNREIQESHIKSLRASILSKNLLEHNPILVNRNMEVLDGQHRLEVAKREELEVFYTIVDGADVSLIREINDANRRWSAYDYVKSYAETGNKDYQTVIDFMKKHDLSASTAASVLAGDHKIRTKMSALRNGFYKVKSLDEAEKFMTRISLLVPHLEYDNIRRDRDFIASVQVLMREGWVSIEDLVTKLEAKALKIPKRASVRDYIRWYEDAWQLGENKKRLYFNF